MTLIPITFENTTAIVSVPDTDEPISNVWKAGNFYEAQKMGMLPRVYALKERYKGKIAVDVGAHWGNHSLFFAAVMEMRVIAFEPRQESFDLLYTNVRGLEVSPHRIVMGDTHFSRYRQINGPDNTTGMTRFEKHNYPQNINLKKRGVAGSCLDLMLPQMEKNLDDLRLIKIDVEGHEYEVLKGAKKIIKKYSPDLWIETETPELILKTLNEHRAPTTIYTLEGPYNSTPTWRYYVNALHTYAP